VTPGARHPERARQNAAAVRSPPLADPVLAAVRDLCDRRIRGQGCRNWWEARAWGRLSGVDHIFTIDEARRLLSEVRSRAEDLIAVRADLVEIRQALSDGSPSPLGGLAEAKALEARMSELLGWFPASGIELKGLAPLLIDFPAVLDGEPVLLCWLEGEAQLGWYHKADYGFAGRRRIPS
jgi:hypothetical protein